ncbi:PIR protein [Plasmodium ovale]|uniref:PIR protein n=1 Tax=Plasmodium ovale TaxID=36330 RepID=A0A1D3JFL2_PLAOA|nr:PIR protein [Plasmodium ovale]
MAEDIVLEALKLLEGEGLQKNVYLHNFYEKFSNGIKNTYEKYEKCIKDNIEKNPPISTVKCRVDENEISLNTLVEEFKSAYEHDSNSCDYLLYWMSDKIDTCKDNSHCIISLYRVFSKFWENTGCCVKKQDNTEGNCNEKFMIVFDKEVIKNIKQLYRFLEHYNKIENSLNEKISLKKETYCKYLKFIFDLYHLMDNEVNERMRKKYEKELKRFENTFIDENKITKLKIECKNPNLSTTSQRRVNTSSVSTESFERFTPDDAYLYKKEDKPPEKMDEILGDTPSYKLYKDFDNDADESVGKECSEVYFKEQSTYKDESIKVCKKIRNNFNKLYDTSKIIKTDKPCLHYKNWVYEEIWKMITKNSYYGDTGEIINKLLKLQKEKNIHNDKNKDICHYYFNFKDFTELNAKKEEKDLHDYFQNYYIIEKKISPNTEEKEKYKIYLEYIYKLYERHKIGWKCCNDFGIDPLCTHYFKCEQEYNPKDLIDILSGIEKETIKNKYKDIPVVRIGEKTDKNATDEKNIMRIQYGRCSRIYDPDDKTKVFSLRCDYQASIDHFKKFHEKLPDGKKKDDEKATASTSISPADMSDSLGISNMEEEESNPVSYKIPTSVSLGIGTAFIFFLYYKFTPFGSLFGKRGRGTTSFEDDFNEEYMQEFSYYDAEYGDVNRGNGRIHIAYQ